MHETDNIKEQAYQDYKSGMKYKDIAAKYGVSLSAVKSWASRYWKKGCKKTEKKLQPKLKVATKKVATILDKKEAAAEDVSEIISSDLTDRQQLFCLYFVRCFNGTKAYRKAYPEASAATARVNSSRLLQDERIQAEVQRLKQAKFNRAMLEEDDIFQMYLDIATADMNDFASVKNGIVDLKDTNDADGMLIREISQGKAGIKVKLYDRMKALDWLAAHMDMATPVQKARFDLIQAQIRKLIRETSENSSIDNSVKEMEAYFEQRKESGSGPPVE